MLSALRNLWRQLPEAARQKVTRTGLPYAASFVSHYADTHRIKNFAGNLDQLKVDYADGDAQKRMELSRQFDAIVDTLVMPNGVTKTTYTHRLEQSLSKVLAAVHLNKSEIRVLDLPASTGVASLQSFELLQERYRINSYTLGDLYHWILYDPVRQCVFDKHGNLLQVAFARHFFSLYRAKVSGEEYTFLSACVLFPHALVASYLRKRYRFDATGDYRRLLVVHPDVEHRLNQGVYRLSEMDIFHPIVGHYDVILSFNLLQRNYFPPDVIEAGVNNLASSLSEGGLLIMGNTESFLALQKQDGSLIARLQEGQF